MLFIKLLALLGIFGEEFIFVAEGVVEDELGEVEEMGISVKLLLEISHRSGEFALVQYPLFPRLWSIQSQQRW